MVNIETKKLWAQKTMELTNIGAGVLLFGQFVTSTNPRVPAMIAGILLIIGGYMMSYRLLQPKRKK